MDIKITDFSKYAISRQYYSGSERKVGIRIKDEEYILKFQKETPFGLRFNHISEYLGSHIFQLLSISVQETYLGIYKGEQIVACKNFIPNDAIFVPFNDVGESTLDNDKNLYTYEYETIMQMLEDNSKLENLDETVKAFWDMYIVDALIANFDRHGTNWGFLKYKNRYTMAPIFDNGSSLYPQLVDEDEMLKTINSEEETNKRVFKFPTSQIKMNGNKSSYYDVISSLRYPECNEALIRIMNKTDFDSINNLINNTPFITEIHKDLYKHLLKARYEKILEASYLKLRHIV